MRVILAVSVALALGGCEVPLTAHEAFGACRAEAKRTYAGAADGEMKEAGYLEPCMAGKGFKEEAGPACMADINSGAGFGEKCFTR